MTVDVGAGADGLGGLWLRYAAAGEWGAAAGVCGVGEGVVRAWVMQLAHRLGVDHVGGDEAGVAGEVEPWFVEGRPPVPELWKRLCSGELDVVDSVYLAAVGRFDLAEALLTRQGLSADPVWLTDTAVRVLRAGGYLVVDGDPTVVLGQLYRALADQSVVDHWHTALHTPSLPDPLTFWDPHALTGWNTEWDAGTGSSNPHNTLHAPLPGDPAPHTRTWTTGTGHTGGAPVGWENRTGPDTAEAMDTTAYEPGAPNISANTTTQTQTEADAADTTAIPASASRKRKRANPTDALPTAVHAPRPASERTQHIDETILAGIRDTPRKAGIAATARHLRMTPMSLTNWLNATSSSLGLDNASGLDTLKHIRVNMADIAPGRVGKQPADLTPDTPAPALLTELDKQVVATLLHHPDKSYLDIALLCNHPPYRMQRWLEGVGQRLGVDKVATDVVAHVRDGKNRARVLHLAGLTDTTIPQHILPTAAKKPLSELDRQVIATLLHHPDENPHQLSVRYHYDMSTMNHWLKGLGRKLPTTGKASEMVAYVRDAANRELMLATAGLTETTIAQHLIPTGQR
ncbi:hypothetical protein, partial [Streptomyces sp. NPDC051014]|uniref:hypothetical protein n=1 Tax=Streptomyces sp. NPDC051014 TaxID=3155751 RepID=UPI0033FD6F6B